MPKTRHQQAARGRNAPDEGVEDPAADSRKSRMALGDVSNRGKSRSSKDKGRAGAARTGNPAEEALRRSSRCRGTTETNEASVLEDASSGDDNAPKRRRSLRSCVLAQRVNNDEANRSSPEKSGHKSKPKPTSNKAEGKATQARGRPTKRRREEEEEVDEERETKKTKRSTGKKGKVAGDKKSSKSSRKCSTSRGYRKSSTTPRKPCSEFLTQTKYELVRTPFDSSKFTLGVAPHDEAKKDDVLEVSNYTTDIFQRLYFAEPAARPPLYMDDQVEITPDMRAILIDWLVEVHMKFRLVTPTLYLCVNIIDRYCAKMPVERRKLQLVGVTALLVACKYEEIYPPEVRDCVYITDRTYTRQEVLDMEQDIVRTLDFKMTVPTAHPFLLRFLLITKATEVMGSAAEYYLERSLQEYQFLKYRPSLVAASAVCLALNNPAIRDDDQLTEPPPGIPRLLLDYTGFSVKEIRKVARILVQKVGGGETIAANNRRHLVAVKRKYESQKFHCVSSDFEDPVMDHLVGGY